MDVIGVSVFNITLPLHNIILSYVSFLALWFDSKLVVEMLIHLPLANAKKRN